MVKVPQILKIIQNQSAKGINFLSVTLDHSIKYEKKSNIKLYN